MAVAKMSKMRLISLSSERGRILDALKKTRAVSIKNTSLSCDAKELVLPESSDLLEKKERVELALSLVEKQVTKEGTKEEAKSLCKDGFGVTDSELFAIYSKEKDILSKADDIIYINKKIIELKSDLIQIENKYNEVKPYENVKESFDSFKDTKTTKVMFGLMQNVTLSIALEKLNEIPGVEAYKVADGVTYSPVCILIYNFENILVNDVLSSYQFTPCQIVSDVNGRKTIEDILESRTNKQHELDDCSDKLIAYSALTKDMKILLDRYNFELEKDRESNKFLSTDSTFILEAFLPTTEHEKVKNAIERTTDKFEIEFLDVTEDDNPPTLMSNGAVAKNFEFVTNMYSVPKYDSFDPNAIMGFFFSLFLGIITADFGYGILLSVAAFLYGKYKCKLQAGMRKLAYILALGGLFAIPFGILFDSCFGIQIIHKICEAKMGVGNSYELFYTAHLDGIKAFSSLAGISIPTLLLWSMLFGALHLMVGYILKGVQEFRRGNIFDGITQGIMWAVFLGGLCVFAFSMVDSVDRVIATPLQTIGLIVAVAGLSIAVIFAGRGTKGIFGKAKSSFGSLYGVINIMSDILSYARLYGLMLSGSQIAAIFTNTIAIDLLFAKGVGGIVGGVLVIIAGNIFNLAMGVLGAYIHVSRLQYVEFFGKFYEGDGELFIPFGSSFDHIVNLPDEVKIK